MHPELPPEQPTKRTHKHLVGLLIFGLVLCLFLAFSFKVFGYYRQLQKGTLDVSQLSFSSTIAAGSRLAAFAKASPGSGELATEDDPSLGSPDAKVTIVQFADFGCPFSREVSYIVRAIAKQFPNDVRFIYRDFPLVDLHPGADIAAQAGECAQDQGKFWELHDLLYRHTTDFTPDVIMELASQVDIDTEELATCMTRGTHVEEVAHDQADAVAAGVVGTPTFFFNGQKVEGSIPFSIFTELVTAFTNVQ